MTERVELDKGMVMQLSDSQKSFVNFVMQGLISAGRERIHGDINFKAVLKDGGITDKWKQLGVKG